MVQQITAPLEKEALSIPESESKARANARARKATFRNCRSRITSASII
jgi:hypothetical protein